MDRKPSGPTRELRVTRMMGAETTVDTRDVEAEGGPESHTNTGRGLGKCALHTVQYKSTKSRHKNVN